MKRGNLWFLYCRSIQVNRYVRYFGSICRLLMRWLAWLFPRWHFLTVDGGHPVLSMFQICLARDATLSLMNGLLHLLKQSTIDVWLRPLMVHHQCSCWGTMIVFLSTFAIIALTSMLRLFRTWLECCLWRGLNSPDWWSYSRVFMWERNHVIAFDRFTTLQVSFFLEQMRATIREYRLWRGLSRFILVNERLFLRRFPWGDSWLGLWLEGQFSLMVDILSVKFGRYLGLFNIRVFHEFFVIVSLRHQGLRLAIKRTWGVDHDLRILF